MAAIVHRIPLSRYVNIYVQYLYLIPLHQLVLSHQLQVACIHGSQTLSVPLPADMHRTSQRGRRNPSRLGRAALSNRVLLSSSSRFYVASLRL